MSKTNVIRLLGYAVLLVIVLLADRYMTQQEQIENAVIRDRVSARTQQETEQKQVEAGKALFAMEMKQQETEQKRVEAVKAYLELLARIPRTLDNWDVIVGESKRNPGIESSRLADEMNKRID